MTALSVYPAGIDAAAARAKQALAAHLFDTSAPAESFVRLPAKPLKRKAYVPPRGRNTSRKRQAQPKPVVPDAAAAAISGIVSSVRTDIIAPLLQAKTVEQFHDLFGEHFAAFIDAMDAIRTVQRTSGAPATAPDRSFMDKYYAALGEIVEPAAEDELRFDVATVDRALAVVRQLRELPPSESSVEESLAKDFRINVAMHTLGLVSLMELAGGAKHSRPAMLQCFELARGGALRAYAAVRQALDTRRPPRASVPMGSGEDIV